ncbi:MAG: galactokinase [Bacteroidota bacterium]
MNEITVASPGRINIIGEHTDYNDGFVLPAAIDKKTVVRLRKNATPSQCKLIAENINETFEFDLQDFRPIKSGWPNYVMGVVHELQQLGAKMEGFEATFGGNVPIGSGMSSSAALECAFAYGLNELFGLGYSQMQLIKASQLAEHHFVGIKCGIMDQFASMMGKKDQVLLLDCRSLEYEYFPLALGDYQLLLFDTKVSHALADSAYNERRAQCEEGVALLKRNYPAISSLRDVSLAQLEAQTEQLSELVYRRCHHVVTENQRVLDTTTALKGGRLDEVGALLYASHKSLSADYEVSCPELDFLVTQTQDNPAVLGARMMGGGFGGCTINLVRKNAVEELTHRLRTAYLQQFGIHLLAYQVTIEDGTHLLDS